MRTFVIVAAGIGTTLSGAALAQTAKNTPEGIICAMTGSCGATATDGDRVAVGDEKAFSLSRPSTATAATPARVTASAPVQRTRVAVATRPTRRPMTTGTVTPTKVSADGGIDMLVTFKLGSAQMTPQAQAEARAFAQAMSAPQMAGMRFAIEGHTDSTGMRDKNITLSEARAQSVMNYLIAQGIDASRLTAKGFGPDRPVRGMSAAAAANRRVEFVKQI